MRNRMNNAKAFQAPLHPLDTEKQTYGCRYANPDFCAKNRLPQVCALVRADKICYAPPHLWPKQFKKLKAEGKYPDSTAEKSQASGPNGQSVQST
jgi:predicted nucleic acid binding AN1-type Zn finger protein